MKWFNGGVFNDNDELIGVVDAYYGFPFYDLAVPVNDIKDFIKTSIKENEKVLKNGV